MAGRYWYLEENRTDEMAAACAEFERSCGNDPLEIAKALKYFGGIDELEPGFARSKLLSLQEECRKRHRCELRFGPRIRRTTAVERESLFERVFFPIGCLIVLAILIFLAIYGFIALVS
jgi:hypothetical protein